MNATDRAMQFPDLARSRRVLVLILGVIALSIADLMVTLTHLRTIGMVEANPIAAYLIRTTGSALSLASFKALTVGICVVLLFHLRTRVQGEVAAWLAVLILAGMSLIWHKYSAQIEDPAKLRLAQTHSADRWLYLD